MTEYWVSQAKYHCKVCNCYIADNHLSRRHHETSMGHKIKTEQFLKQKKNEKLQETRNEQELKRTLEQMEKAARAAMNQPVTREIPNWIGSMSVPPPSISFKPMEPIHVVQQISRSNDPQNVLHQEFHEPGFKEEDSPGFYTVRGVTYLEGNKFENKLRNGANCEVFVEDIDEWMPVEQLTRKEIEIPNTSSKFLRFGVVYLIKNEDESFQQRSLEGVKSDQLRIIASEQEVADLSITKDSPKSNSLPTNSLVDTGVIGGWQTVSVRTIDEEKEREQSDAAVEAMRRGDHTEENIEFETAPKHIQSAKEFVYSSQPIIYKGVTLQDEAASATVLSNIERDEHSTSTQFIKRRKLNMNPRATAGGSSNSISNGPPQPTIVIVPTIVMVDSIESKEDNESAVEQAKQQENSSESNALEIEKSISANKISFKLTKPTTNFRRKS